MITGINELRALTKHASYKSRCNLDQANCNSN